MGEQRLVVLVDTAGRYELHTGKVCTLHAADFLEQLAAQLRASHPPHRCAPSATATSPAARPDEQLLVADSRFDPSARVWTDGRGHAWDLSLTWVDMMGAEWRWRGVLDDRGAPLLRANKGVTVQSLDVVRALYGPLSPAPGDAS
ncbi:phiSA1p31-related protein [Streptomyces nigra]|uniref:phiSA1p31-related protein n=1 Tax=Streptomyces nigra TaxID=1827580 RepID=UPI0036B16039